MKITIHAESRRAICAKKMQKLSRHGEWARELKLQTTTTRNFATIWQSWKQWNSWKTRISFGLMCTNVIGTMPHVTFNWLTARNHSVSRRKCNNIAIDEIKERKKGFTISQMATDLPSKLYRFWYLKISTSISQWRFFSKRPRQGSTNELCGKLLVQYENVRDSN